MKYIEAVGAVLYDNCARVFLAKRPKGKVLANKWEFPGGKIEQGESLEDCLRREIKEELNIKVTPKAYIGKQVFEYGYGTVCLHLFACPFNDGYEIELIEHQDGKWVELSQVLEFDVPQIIYPFMDSIKKTFLHLKVLR